MTEQEQVMLDFWDRTLKGKVDGLLAPLRSEVADLRAAVDRLREAGAGVAFLTVPAFAGAEVVEETGVGGGFRYSE